MYINIARIAAVMSLASWLVVGGCSEPTHEIYTGLSSNSTSSGNTSDPSDDQASGDSAACSAALFETYKTTYMPFLQRQCASCHVNGPGVGAFATSEPAASFTSFNSIGRDKIDFNAKNDSHHPPYTGAKWATEVNSISASYDTARKGVSACQNIPTSSSTKIAPVSLSMVKSSGTTFLKYGWNLTTQLASDQSATKALNAMFWLDVRIAMLGGKVVGYEIRNPIMQSRDASATLYFDGILVWVNGAVRSDVTQYKAVPVAVAPGTSAGPVSNSAIAFLQMDVVADTDVIALEFINLRSDGVTAPASGGGSTPTPTPSGGSGSGTTVTFTQLAASTGAFGRACVSCHNNNNGAGGLNLQTYNSAWATGAPVLQTIISRINSANNPMPPSGSGTLTAQEKANIQAWVNAGAPR